VARDRQRAKQRKARRAQNPGPAPSQPHRENVPGELDHASGDVDRFEAELISGADSEPDPVDELELEREPVREELIEDEDDAADDDDAVDDDDADDDDDAVDDAVEPAATPAVAREGAVPGQPTKRGASRFLAFIRASWAELQRVQWPDRRQVAQATAVVLGFVVIAGAYLGLADAVAQEIVDIII
jgi:preprotein translocase subunit SecE